MYDRKDAFYRRAKASGYRSRAAYKLLELTRPSRLLRRGARVVDLGAWPGGWLQVAAECVGPTGRVVGVDLQPIGDLRLPNVVTLQGDFTRPEVRAEVTALCGGSVDVLLSDLSPKLSGVRARDEAQAEALVDCVFAFAAEVLADGGALVVKLFMGPGTAAVLARLRGRFRDVRTTRPEATRKGSAEVYAIARGFAAAPGA